MTVEHVMADTLMKEQGGGKRQIVMEFVGECTDTNTHAKHTKLVIYRTVNRDTKPTNL